MKYIVPVSMLLVISIIACKKDFPSLKLEGTFKPTAITVNGNVVMYTKNGPVTDQALIRAYFQRIIPNDPYSNYFDNTIFHPSHPPYNLKFLGNDLVDYIAETPNGTFTTHARITQQSGSEVKITNLDSLNDFQLNATCVKLARLVTGFNPISNCTSNNNCRYLPFFKLRIENGVLYQYMITFLLSNTKIVNLPGLPPSSQTCADYEISVWDNFDPNIYQQFDVGDTLIIQSRKAQFGRFQ